MSLWHLSVCACLTGSSLIDTGAPPVLPGFELRTGDGDGINVTLSGAARVTTASQSGLRAFPQALPGVDMFVQARPDGFEDRLLVRQVPPGAVVRYRVELAGIAGLRMVDGSRTVEFLRADGTPTLRMVAPWWRPGERIAGPLDGSERPLEVRIPDCEYDRQPRPPWGRPVVSPGRSACTIELSWQDAQVPAVIDPVWTTTAAMAHPRYQHIAMEVGGRVLVAGGTGTLGDFTAEKTSELWDQMTGTWASAGELPGVWHDPRAVRLEDGRVFMAGGYGLSGGIASAAVFDATQSAWTPAASMSAARERHTLTLLDDGRVLACGGRGPLNKLTDSCEVFDPEQGSWTVAAALPAIRMDHAAVRLSDGRVLIAGGDNDDKPDQGDSFAALFDPGSGEWKSLPPPPATPSSTSLLLQPDGRVLLVGALRGSTLSGITSLFDPVTESWQPAAAVPTPRTEPGVVSFPDGRVLLLGGQDSNGPTASGFAYRAGDDGGSWLQLGAMSTPRMWPGATMLQDGRVLVTGGFAIDVESPGAQASAELLTLADLGAECSTDSECATLYCVDSVCCENSCAAGCVACSGKARGDGTEDGVCRPIAAGLDPKAACSEEPPCGRTGECDGKGDCAVESAGVSCGPDQCVAGVPALSLCDGSGTCSSKKVPCAGGFVCEASGSCKSSCNTDSDCQAGWRCDAKLCAELRPQGTACSSSEECRAGLTCADQVCCDTGNATDCGNYRCAAAGVCRTECDSSSDCADGARCDASHRCVRDQAQAIAPSESGGCSCVAARGNGGGWWVGGLIAPGMLAASRRRRKQSVNASA